MDDQAAPPLRQPTGLDEQIDQPVGSDANRGLEILFPRITCGEQALRRPHHDGAWGFLAGGPSAIPPQLVDQPGKDVPIPPSVVRAQGPEQAGREAIEQRRDVGCVQAGALMDVGLCYT